MKTSSVTDATHHITFEAGLKDGSRSPVAQVTRTGKRACLAQGNAPGRVAKMPVGDKLVIP